VHNNAAYNTDFCAPVNDNIAPKREYQFYPDNVIAISFAEKFNYSQIFDIPQPTSF